MAALDLQEQEQIDALKAWWKDNGKYVLGAVLLLVIAFGGWRGWQSHQKNKNVEAATLYAEFTRQLESNDAKRVNDAAAAVMGKYADSAYAAHAALLAAQFNEFKKDVAHAKTQLQWVIDHADEASLKDVARLRLAAILLDEKSYDAAMKLLNAAHPDSFNGLYSDLKGDVLNAQGKTDEARTAYKLAFDKTDAKSMYRNLIQMKMDALGVAK
ncbi:MAG TPA: tetratricopeptide repeat protein [Gallionella sp.]|nr:tetratricopeptide repeat protein [Gallionella sp.]